MAVMAVLVDGAGDDDGDGRAGAGADGGGAGRCSRMMLVVGRWSAEKGTHGSMMPVMRVMMQTLPGNRSSKNDYIYTFCQLPLTLLASAPGSALGGIERDEEAWCMVVRKERFIRNCKWPLCDLVEEWMPPKNFHLPLGLRRRRLHVAR